MSERHIPLPTHALIKIPRQPRSILMVHSILDSAIEVIQVEGLAAMSTNRVAERAGVSIGSLYQYFANRDSILAGVIERSLLDVQNMLSMMHMDMLNTPMQDGVRIMLMAMLRYYDPWMEVLRRVFREAPLLADNGLILLVERMLLDQFRDYLLHNSHRYRIKGGKAGLHTVISALAFLYLRWLVQPFPHVTEEAFVEAMLQLLMGMVDEPIQA
ncbi:MAG: helix-turn-helix domain-containing protein [Aquabacterium sp.]|nr:helix-turn-helix domain-containing protein [Aquabacterium sp.]